MGSAPHWRSIIVSLILTKCHLIVAKLSKWTWEIWNDWTMNLFCSTNSLYLITKSYMHYFLLHGIISPSPLVGYPIHMLDLRNLWMKLVEISVKLNKSSHKDKKTIYRIDKKMPVHNDKNSDSRSALIQSAFTSLLIADLLKSRKCGVRPSNKDYSQSSMFFFFFVIGNS